MPVRRPTPRKMYRTMQGRMVDIEKLRGANESTKAVGNMNVNARGDVLGPGGKIVKKKEKVMREYYETPKGRAVQRTVTKPKMPQPTPQPRQVETKLLNKPFQPAKPKAQPKTGIDAALDGIE